MASIFINKLPTKSSAITTPVRTGTIDWAHDDFTSLMAHELPKYIDAAEAITEDLVAKIRRHYTKNAPCMYTLPIDRDTDVDTVKAECHAMYEAHKERLCDLLRFVKDMKRYRKCQVEHFHSYACDSRLQRIVDLRYLTWVYYNFMLRLGRCLFKAKRNIEEVMQAGNGCEFLLNQGCNF
jgi:hypothetical protein